MLTNAVGSFAADGDSKMRVFLLDWTQTAVAATAFVLGWRRT
jgi:hypothetical protein